MIFGCVLMERHNHCVNYWYDTARLWMSIHFPGDGKGYRILINRDRWADWRKRNRKTYTAGKDLNSKLSATCIVLCCFSFMATHSDNYPLMMLYNIKGQDVLGLIEFQIYCCTAVPLHGVTAPKGLIITLRGFAESVCVLLVDRWVGGKSKHYVAAWNIEETHLYCIPWEDATKPCSAYSSINKGLFNICSC